MLAFRIAIFLLLSTIITSANSLDSLIVKRDRKFSVEIGRNTCYILSNKVINNFHNYRHAHGINRFTSIGVLYKINNNYKSFLSYSMYGDYYKGNLSKGSGQVMELFFFQLSAGMQKKLIQKGNFQDYAHLSLNYRHGYEFVYFSHYFNEIQTGVSEYNSFGLGIGDGISYTIKTRTFITLEAGYFHFFEKSRLDPSSEFPGHKPISDLIVGHIKLGIKF